MKLKTIQVNHSFRHIFTLVRPIGAQNKARRARAKPLKHITSRALQDMFYLPMHLYIVKRQIGRCLYKYDEEKDLNKNKVMKIMKPGMNCVRAHITISRVTKVS